MLDYIKQHKLLSFMFFFNVVAVLIAILIIVIHSTKTATIDILVAPTDAVIELNGAKYDNLKSHNITPGDYHVKISMDGMQSKELDLAVKDGEMKKIWTYLLDENGEFSYYVDHPDDATILKEVADSEAKNFLEDYNKKQSILDVLPLTFSNTFEENATEVVSISIRWGTGEECKEKPYCLIVRDYTGKNTEKALQMIKDAGYDPDDYELIFEKGEDE